MTHTIPTSLEQLQAERYPLQCCEGAHAVVEMKGQANFLSGTTIKHIIRCSNCLQAVQPVTTTTLRPLWVATLNQQSYRR